MQQRIPDQYNYMFSMFFFLAYFFLCNIFLKKKKMVHGVL